MYRRGTTPGRQQQQASAFANPDQPSYQRQRANSDSTANKARQSSRKLLLACTALIALVFLALHWHNPGQTAGAASSGSYKSLPGFGFGRSQASRRLDVSKRYDRKRKSAASIQGSSYPPSNFTEEPPFSFCPTFNPNDELSHLYGPDAILKTRAHLGSTERIRKVLRRAMAGLPVTVAVLGGSVSSCHGLDATPSHPLGNPVGPNCYPHRIFSWLNDVFPHPANEMTNGALRRTGTSYFGFCSEMHLPDRADLIIVEFDTEDPHDSSTLASTDLLVRSLLLRSDLPAVILLGHFSPQIQGEHGYAGPEIWHSAVAQFYDVPYLTVKGLLYEDYLTNQNAVRQSYFLDPVLANPKGHELLADTVIAYLESEICLVWDAEGDELRKPGSSRGFFGPGGGITIPGGDDAPPSLLGGKGLRKVGDGFDDDADSASSSSSSKKLTALAQAARIPPFRITDKPHTVKQYREVKPFCASANDLINPLPSSVFSGSGWEPVAPKADDEDERHYWFSDTPGALLKVPIKVTSGDIAVYYLKGPSNEGWGNVLCWVDDNTGGAVELKGSWDRDYGQPTVTQIDKGVTKGSHYVVCELQRPEVGNSKFKIFGAFAT